MPGFIEFVVCLFVLSAQELNAGLQAVLVECVQLLLAGFLGSRFLADFGYLFGQIGGSEVERQGWLQTGGGGFAVYIDNEFVAVVGLADGVAERANVAALAVWFEGRVASGHHFIVFDAVAFIDFHVVGNALFQTGLGFRFGGKAQGGFAGKLFVAFGSGLGGADVGDFEAELVECSLDLGGTNLRSGQFAVAWREVA